MRAKEETPRVAVVGASGFIGSATVRALESRGTRVIRVTAPRLASRPSHAVNDLTDADRAAVDALSSALVGMSAVVNCAGDPDASSTDVGALVAANGCLPGIVARAAADVHCPRVVHVSSAVVQGRRAVLDETLTYDAFSSYATSKMLGEQQALCCAPGKVVVYRPPSVHATSRRVTRMTARIARSPLSTVATGEHPTPQALIENVASAIAYLALTEQQPPRVVIHPWEGLTTASLLHALGGRWPARLPAVAAHAVMIAGRVGEHLVPRFSANVRRVEMIWFGQRQAPSWLTTAGWTPPVSVEGWHRLGRSLAAVNEEGHAA